MELRWSFRWATLASCLAIAFAIPPSLVDEIKSDELRDNKVKRAHPSNVEEHPRDVPYFNKPTAIKRGTNLKSPNPEQQSLSQWEQEQALYQNPESLANIQSTLYNIGENPFDDKTVAEYEKGFHYGTNKERLDEALENAVLKSELYGQPTSINQYRYYGEDRRRRRRRSARKTRPEGRKIKLTPEEMLIYLGYLKNEREKNEFLPWTSDEETGEEDEDWMEEPVEPFSSSELQNNDIPMYHHVEPPYDASPSWTWDRRKRFMVAKKRNDPTRELRYLNGPNKNDFYTLSQLLSSQREPNVPLYHRLVL